MEIEGRPIGLQIWDTAGSEKFFSIGASFYKGSDCCVIVYDVTNPDSLQHATKWYQEFLKNCSLADTNSFPVALVGNKIDLKESRKTNPSDALEWCQAHDNAPHFETSAKEGTQVREAFRTVGILAMGHKSQSLYD